MSNHIWEPGNYAYVKPQAEARRWVYRCIAAALLNDTELNHGWFWPGDGEDVNEFDRRRIRKACLAVSREMTKKAGR